MVREDRGWEHLLGMRHTATRRSYRARPKSAVVAAPSSAAVINVTCQSGFALEYLPTPPGLRAVPADCTGGTGSSTGVVTQQAGGFQQGGQSTSLSWENENTVSYSGNGFSMDIGYSVYGVARVTSGRQIIYIPPIPDPAPWSSVYGYQTLDAFVMQSFSVDQAYAFAMSTRSASLSESFFVDSTTDALGNLYGYFRPGVTYGLSYHGYYRVGGTATNGETTRP